MPLGGSFVKLSQGGNTTLTRMGEAAAVHLENAMADPIDNVRRQLSERIDDIRRRSARLSPLAMHAQMDAIRETAAANGLLALEGLAHCSAQLALLPGHRVSTGCCLDHMDAAIASRSNSDCETILAALAARLH